MNIYLENCELLLKLLNIYENNKNIQSCSIAFLSDLTNYNNFKNIYICTNRKDIIDNNNILLDKYLKKKYINIENIDDSILIILNLLSEGLLQVYDILEKNILISINNNKLFYGTNNISTICAYIFPYVSYVIFYYNANDILEKNNNIILDYLYFTFYNINKSMNIEITRLPCFQNIKNKYIIDKLYMTDFSICPNFTTDNPYLINFIVDNFKNTSNLLKCKIRLDRQTLDILIFRKKYILDIFNKLVTYWCCRKRYRHIFRLENNNKCTIKELIKFVIIVSAMDCNDNCDSMYKKFISYYTRFIEKNFNYIDFEEIINITNNITDLIGSGILVKYHVYVLKIISNFKELCELFLKNNFNITSKLHKDKSSYHVLNKYSAYIIDTRDMFNTRIERCDYITTYNNLMKNKHIEQYPCIPYFFDKFTLILENKLYCTGKQYDMSVSYKMCLFDIIKHVRKSVKINCDICINIFTKMHNIFLKTNRINKHNITLKCYRKFDTKFYKLNVNIQNIAYENICLYYTIKCYKGKFILDSLQLIYYNGYAKVSKLLENVIDVIFKKDLMYIIFSLSYIIYILNIDSELSDYIIKKLYDGNIFNTIEFKYILLECIKYQYDPRASRYISDTNKIVLNSRRFINTKINNFDFKYKNADRTLHNNILSKMQKNAMLYDLFFNFENVDNTFKIQFD